VLRQVTADDEWCAEAYMDTDYERIGPDEFDKFVRDFTVYRLLGTDRPFGDAAPGEESDALVGDAPNGEKSDVDTAE